ncbi:MAG: hypothetical protein OEY21_07710 [Nitrospira sp.]|nr:hypothetical protein [Nitrospira sp.]
MNLTALELEVDAEPAGQEIAGTAGPLVVAPARVPTVNDDSIEPET